MATTPSSSAAEKQAARSTYEYEVLRTTPMPLVIIRDLNQGMSVTNNAESVCQAILARENLAPDGCTIIYRDTEGIYDGIFYDGSDVRFYPLSLDHSVKIEKEAICAVKWA